MRRRLPDMLIIALLFALPLVFFWQQTLGGKTLLPTENLYRFEPFATYREVVNAPAVPHNALLDDLVLENYQWKSFIRESLKQGEFPLWNPHQFAGIPFFAAGQPSTLYPLNIVYYVLDLPAAYGWFTVLNLWLAGAFMFAFVRGLRVGRVGALVAGIVYQLSAFMLISAVFPMIIGAAVWLPLLLLMVEYVIRQQPFFGRPSSVPWVAIGAGALGCNILAGHVELTYYTLIIVAYYAGARLVGEWRMNRHPETRRLYGGIGLTLPSPGWYGQRAGWLVGMVILGFGLGAIQFTPLLELVRTNWRSDSATYQDVIGWAHPARDVAQFFMPNFYGNPAHHSYFDMFTGQTVTQFTNAAGQPMNTIDWGIKNYVEGALYLGILPLVLAVYALVNAWILRHSLGPQLRIRQHMIIFAFLTFISLTFMFGLPTYALLYYGFPGLNQSHTPFRWIFGVTVGVAVLAGFGMDYLELAVYWARKPAPGQGARVFGRDIEKLLHVTVRRFGYALCAVGVVILLVLLASRIFYTQIEPLISRVFNNLAQANQAFSDARMFYSYEFTNVLIFGMMTLGAGIVFWLAGRDDQPNFGPVPLHKRINPLHPYKRINPLRSWHILAILLIVADLMMASWGFNPASDPALLDFTPPAIQWLMQQPGHWRYTTLDDPAQPKLMNANVGMHYGLDDIRGYESIIPKQYVDLMGQLAPQVQLDFNRIAPLYTAYPESAKFNFTDALNSPLLDTLNVRYIMTHKSVPLDNPRWKLAYTDEAVNIWENTHYDEGLAAYAYLTDNPATGKPNVASTVAVSQDTGREKFLDVTSNAGVWLVVSESYFPGWRAYIRPQGADKQDEKPLVVQPTLGNFQGMQLPDAGKWTVRLVYSPTSFNIGLFGSAISVALIVFLGGVWVWRLMVAPEDTKTSGMARVARNSVAPIMLNLFNRGIDFAFAFVMLRVLGPDNAGIYYYAVIVFGWFDIFTNFGLNTFLTREVARDRSQAWRYLFNTSILRLVLAVVGVGLLAAFLVVRQATPPVLSYEGVLAMVLLYVGLLPNSLSTGLSALFYAFERAEYPAAIATIATICKAVFGVLALVFGYGVVGLAGVSILTNIITLVVMLYVARGLIEKHTSPPDRLPDEQTGQPQTHLYRPDRKLIRSMIGESFPLMLNHFLATIFFQIDVVIIQPNHGDKMVGQYSVAYKWVSALNIIPAFFTMALLPVMSRQAHEDRAALKRNYTLAIKLLVSVALPTAVLFTFLAYALTGLLGGSEYLPDGAIATQIMIWSIPIGWMNSLTQYVLIALDLQRRITLAFFVAVTFNIVSNLLLIPPYGYRAAALTTIASEAVLLIPFVLLLQGALGPLDWLGMVWKPLVAAGAMIGVLLVGWAIQPILALLVALLVYPAVLWGLRVFSLDEQARLMPLLPARIRNFRRTMTAKS